LLLELEPPLGAGAEGGAISGLPVSEGASVSSEPVSSPLGSVVSGSEGVGSGSGSAGSSGCSGAEAGS
jgi:hypothetical protein